MTDCAHCTNRKCYAGADCFGIAYTSAKLIADNPALEAVHRAATEVEGRYYCQKTRIEEIIEFAKLMGYRKLGIAFCIGLAEEAALLSKVLEPHFEVASVCCKAGGLSKDEMGLVKIRPQKPEVSCNPFGQAHLLNEAGCELNIICGLCVGHEAVFMKLSNAPVVTAITKDRVLAHNPAAALYCQYLRRRLEAGK